MSVALAATGVAGEGCGAWRTEKHLTASRVACSADRRERSEMADGDVVPGALR